MVPCNLLPLVCSSSSGNGKNVNGGQLLFIFKQISKLKFIIVISRLYKISLPWLDL